MGGSFANWFSMKELKERYCKKRKKINIDIKEFYIVQYIDCQIHRTLKGNAVLKQKSLNIYNKIGVQTTKYWCSVGITIFSFFVSSNENLPNFIITPTVKCNFISMTKILVLCWSITYNKLMLHYAKQNVSLWYLF